MKNSIILSFILFIPFLISAQCDKLENHPDGKEAALQLFVYRDFIKNKQYKEAFPNWEELYKCCKAGNGNILKDGIRIYRSFAENAKDTIEQREHYLKVAQFMKEEIECYGNKIRRKTGLPYYGFRYYILGKHYFKNLKDYEKAAFYFEKSIEADGNVVEPNLIDHYSFVAVKLYNQDLISQEEFKEIVKRLMEICKSDKTRFKEVEKGLYKYLHTSKDGVFECEYYVYKLTPLFYEHHTDADYMIKIAQKLKKVGCSDSSILLNLATERYSYLWDSIMGDRDNIDNGNIRLRDAKIEEAKKYYALGIDDSYIPIEKRYKGCMRLAKLHQKDKDWEQALKYYNKAKELNPNSGEPYTSIGMLYLSANKTCEDFIRRLVVSAALDEFEKGMQFEDEKENAKDKIKTYTPYLPDTADFDNHSDYVIGQEMTVGCVLEVKTVIRVKD